MFPVLNVGPLAIQTRGLIILLAIWFASEAAERGAEKLRGAKRLGLAGDHVYNLVFLSAVAGVLGARLGYVIEHVTIYQNYPAQIIALDLNTLSPVWGVLIGLLAAYAYARRKRVADRTLLDALTPGFAVLAAGLALADLASGDGYGSPASLPWSIELWGAARHPTQIYQLLAVGVIGWIVLKSDRVYDGWRFGLFVALYAASRLIVEAFRGDSVTVNGVRTAQVWSLIVIVVAVGLLRRWARPPHEPKAVPQP
ncbi:MAG TPA: prolipoprotein diacylglyceryl transferase family protein [Anaerolineae bacterium]|nr:prolipoprotein diacylglyceryl transferase family protein [Anaerolineae bacterium]